MFTILPGLAKRKIWGVKGKWGGEVLVGYALSDAHETALPAPLQRPFVPPVDVYAASCV
jgi:hypothetical protein